VQQAIGLKSPIPAGFGFFGTIDKLVAFIYLRRKLVSKKLFTAATKSSPTTDQEALKKSAVKPSGPGALFGFMLKRVALISSTVTSLFNKTTLSIETIGGIKSLSRLACCLEKTIEEEPNGFIKPQSNFFNPINIFNSITYLIIKMSNRSFSMPTLNNPMKKKHYSCLPNSAIGF